MAENFYEYEFYDVELPRPKPKEGQIMAEETVAAEAAPKEKGFEHLIIGKHVKLRCGCEGFITSAKNSEFREERWFAVVYTIGKCAKRENYQNFYGEGGELRKDTFHADTFGKVFPFEEASAPEWFPSVEAGPKIFAHRRFIRVVMKSAHPSTFVIPGSSTKPNVYVAATSLRERLDPALCDVEVFECDGNLAAAWEAARKLEEKGPQSTVEKNKLALLDWILGMFSVSSERYIIQASGRSPLGKDEITEILERASKHTLNRSHMINITAMDGSVISLNSEGKAVKI